MKWAALIVLAGLLTRMRAATPPMLDGEQLTYSVAWAIIPGAGRITVNAQASTDANGSPYLRVVTTTETRGLAHLILPFRARAESLYDRKSGQLLWFGEQSSTRGKDGSHSILFDYSKQVAQYQDPSKSEEPKEIPLAGPEPADLINCLLQARAWHLVPGQTHDAVVFFEDDFYLLTIHAIRYEDVDTGIGTHRALLLEPRMEKTPAMGMFKRGSTVRVWLGTDGAQLPLQFQVQFKVGAGLATLSAYRPGVARAAAAPAPAPAGRT